MATQLSKYFTLEDLTTTSTGIDNTPDFQSRANLQRLALLLDFIYDQIGPFRVTSGYRSPAVNEAVGGATGSYHSQGIAADMAPLNDTPYDFFVKILSSSLFGQVGELINEADEKGVCHVSLPTATKQSVAMYLQNGAYYRYSQAEVEQLQQGSSVTPDESSPSLETPDSTVASPDDAAATSHTFLLAALVLATGLAIIFIATQSNNEPEPA